MKKFIACSLIFLCPAAAFGADLLGKAPAGLRQPSAAAATDSSGFYAGVNAAGGFGDVNISAMANQANANATIRDTRLTRAGPLGGVQAGFAVQSGPVVYGVEADMDFGALRGTLSTHGVATNPAVGGAAASRASFDAKVESRFNALGTLRGRVGYAFDNVLIYGKGGYATAHHDAKASLQADGLAVPGVAGTPPAAGTSLGAITVHQWVHGWTLGAGTELAFSRNMSLKLEYLNAQLSNKVAGQNLSHSLNIVRTGLNYRF